MDQKLARLQTRIHEMQQAIQQQIDTRRKLLGYRIEHRKIVFEADIRRAHRAARENLATFLGRARFLVILTAPVIYSLIIPFVLLDLFVSLYQAICFPVYGIEKVRRRDYIAIDRQHLAYLNGLQKLNCVYCGYCNGLAGFVREIAGRTEQRWCPIKHARRLASSHDHTPYFADFGDADAFAAEIARLGAGPTHIPDKKP